jgi:upstream activation factor subunit UAF30
VQEEQRAHHDFRHIDQNFPFDAPSAVAHNRPKTQERNLLMATTTTKKSGGKGLAAEVTPSSDLAPIVGDKPLPRSQVTKKVWDYIKAHKLQDQTNKRMINADDKLLKIFNGKKQVSMFEMTALVSKHLKA